MPTPPKRLDNQRKHLTKAERQARQAAEQDLERETRAHLRMPAWLSDDARKIWADVRRRVRALELLDNVDAEMLGIYCDSVAHYRVASKLLVTVDEAGKPVATDEHVKQAQAWARIVSTFAEKLGLTPNGRARLAKRKAEKEPPDELEQLLDDVVEFVNRDGKA